MKAFILCSETDEWIENQVFDECGWRNKSFCILRSSLFRSLFILTKGWEMRVIRGLTNFILNTHESSKGVEIKILILHSTLTRYSSRKHLSPFFICPPRIDEELHPVALLFRPVPFSSTFSVWPHFFVPLLFAILSPRQPLLHRVPRDYQASTWLLTTTEAGRW